MGVITGHVHGGMDRKTGGVGKVWRLADNIAVNIENIDAARSAYLDLNIAEEISHFTAKQVLQQAGVSIAAQANQLPGNLLQLFQ